MASLKVGIQMYSVRHNMEKDPAATIAKVGEIGYKYIEFADVTYATDKENNFKSGFYADAKVVRKAAADAGCVILGSHVHPLDKTNIDKVLEYHTELGSQFIVSKTASRTHEEDLRYSELYNYLGERCKAAGIQHVLHSGIPHYNDHNEWILDVIAENTDPELTKYELDTYWTLRSDHDVIECIKKYADRLIFLHEKDLAKDFNGKLDVTQGGSWNFFDRVKKEDFVEIGEGKIDHQAYIDVTLKHSKATHIILEQDFTQLDEIESIRVSMSNFKKMKNIDLS